MCYHLKNTVDVERKAHSMNARTKKVIVTLLAVITVCMTMLATPRHARATQQYAQSAENGYMFNNGFYFYRNETTPLSSVSGDMTYVGNRNPYIPQASGGAYGNMDIYSTLKTPTNSIGDKIVARYNDAGSVRDTSRPDWAQPCDLEITFIVRHAHDYSYEDMSNHYNSLVRPGTTEVGVAKDLSHGFRFTGIDYADMQIRFYYPGTNDLIPINSMWFSSASLQNKEGFNLDHAITGYVSGEAFNLSPDADHSGWKGDAYRNSTENQWHAVDGAYVYEYGAANGGTYGFFGSPTLGHAGDDGNNYEIIDSMPSDKTFPDGHYAKRTLSWRAGSVLADLSTTNVMTGAIFSWSWNALRNYSAGVQADYDKIAAISAAYPDDKRGNMTMSGGAIWFVPNFAPATAIVPPPPVKSVDKAYVTGGETLNYTITQRIGKRASDMAEDMTYDGFSFSDTLPTGLDYVGGSFSVRDQFGNDVTGYGSLNVSGQTVTFSFFENYLDNVMTYNGGTFTFRLSATVNANTLQNSSIRYYDDTAKTVFNNRYELNSNTVRTTPYVIDVAVRKVSDYPDLLTGNALYSLAGAKFDARRNGESNVLHTYTTDANGNAAYHRYVGKADYTVTETQRSAGHNIANPASQGFSLNESTTATEITLTYVEPPIVLTPTNISLKLDDDKASTSVTPKWQGDAGDGRNFKVRVDFYPNLTWSGSAYASAVFKADNNGVVAFANATPVDGTSWRYRYANKNVIPLGSIKITEVAAPTGYRVNPNPRLATITDSNGTAILNEQ